MEVSLEPRYEDYMIEIIFAKFGWGRGIEEKCDFLLFNRSEMWDEKKWRWMESSTSATKFFCPWKFVKKKKKKGIEGKRTKLFTFFPFFSFNNKIMIIIYSILSRVFVPQLTLLVFSTKKNICLQNKINNTVLFFRRCY